MRSRIAVIGQSGTVSDALIDMAYRVGAAVARQGGILLTGGRNGIMEAACRGAKTAGGLTVGILPGDDPTSANAYVDVPITTGLGVDFRSLVLIHSADAVIVIAGANGTLLELSEAYLCARPVVALASAGGWSQRIQSVVYADKYLDHRQNVELQFVDDPEEAVARALAAIPPRSTSPSVTDGADTLTAL